MDPAPPPPAPAPISPQKMYTFKDSTFEEVLEDLSSRFILNLPPDELSSVERIIFQVEQAHWYYEDNVREENPQFPSLPLKRFSQEFFRACPLLHEYSLDHDARFQEWLDYKTSVPVCGCILLNPTWDKCVLVKGWKPSSGWSFPKGKINADEASDHCAARETLEETGFDPTDKLIPWAYIKMSVKEQENTMYVVPYVPEDTVFETQTKKEISRIEWFKLADLPNWRNNRDHRRVDPNVREAQRKFWAVHAFIGPLKTRISQLRNAEAAAMQRQAAPHASLLKPMHLETPAPAASRATPLVQPLSHVDPAIVSARKAPENDHLSRLLGELDISSTLISAPSIVSSSAPSIPSAPSATSATNTTANAVGSLLTPLSPHATAQQRPLTPPITPTTLPAASKKFTSPTPPDSNDLRLQSAVPLDKPKPKPNFAFVSPFEAFAPTSPVATKAKAASPPQAVSTPSLASSSTVPSKLSATAPSNNSEIISPSASSPPAVHHIAPPSVLRARLSNQSVPRSSTPSAARHESHVSPPARSFSVAANVTPQRKAQQLALLQSITGGIMGQASSSPTRDAHRDVFVVDPSATVNLSHQPLPPPPPPVMPPRWNPNNVHPAMVGIEPMHLNQPPFHMHPVNDMPPPIPMNHPPPLRPTSLAQAAIPVIPPAAPLPREQLLSLLNGNGNGVPPNAFKGPSMRSGTTPAPVMVGPPIRGLNAPESPFVVHPPPPPSRSFQPVYQPGFPQAPPPPPSRNLNLLSILNRPPPANPNPPHPSYP